LRFDARFIVALFHRLEKGVSFLVLPAHTVPLLTVPHQRPPPSRIRLDPWRIPSPGPYRARHQPASHRRASVFAPLQPADLFSVGSRRCFCRPAGGACRPVSAERPRVSGGNFGRAPPTCAPRPDPLLLSGGPARSTPGLPSRVAADIRTLSKHPHQRAWRALSEHLRCRPAYAQCYHPSAVDCRPSATRRHHACCNPLARRDQRQPTSGGGYPSMGSVAARFAARTSPDDAASSVVAPNGNPRLGAPGTWQALLSRSMAVNCPGRLALPEGLPSPVCKKRRAAPPVSTASSGRWTPAR